MRTSSLLDWFASTQDFPQAFPMAFNLRRFIPGRWLAGGAAPVPAATERMAVETPTMPLWPSASLRDDPVVPQRWRAAGISAEILAGMEPHQFQALCKALFAPTGAEAQTTPRQPEGTLDIRLFSQRERTPVTMVRCMHAAGHPVGVPELRRFQADMASQRLHHGTFATSSTFTPEALDFASDSGFSALDGGNLVTMIERRTPQQQRALLAAAAAASESS